MLIPRYEDGVMGLPDDRVITITNTERNSLGCPKAWWFKHNERLESPPSPAQRFGSFWDDALCEVHRWWALTDSEWPMGAEAACPFCAIAAAGNTPCTYCAGSGLGVFSRIAKAIAVALPPEEGNPLFDRLQRAWAGWMVKYGRAPYTTLRVAGVQTAIAREIVHPRTGRPYRPQTLLVVSPDGSRRLARSGEATGATPIPVGCELQKVQWPYYQVGKLDCVLVHRKSGAIYVGEWKSSASPSTLLTGLSVDPQTAGYAWMLDQAEIRAQFGGGDVVGYVYDVTSSSYQYDPDTLKSGKLSLARSRNVPSWRFASAALAGGHLLSEFREHILKLSREVDGKLYQREWGSVSGHAMSRYGDELYGIAKRIATMRRASALAQDEIDINAAVPRVAVCRAPGAYCEFRAPCLFDGEDTRSRFTVGSGPTYCEKEHS